MNNYKKECLEKNQFHIEIMLTRKCNLNCRSCRFFSNLSKYSTKEMEYNLDLFKKDVKYLSENINVGSFVLIGGEPLLKDDILEYIKEIRKYFPNTNVSIFTNGTLLHKLDRKFVNNLCTLRCGICYTNYSMFNKIYARQIKRLASYGFHIHAIGDIDPHPIYNKREKSEMYTLNFNLNPDSNIIAKSFETCRCDIPQIFNSKIYKCGIHCNVEILNETLDFNFPEEGTNMYDLKGYDDFYEYVTKGCEMCAYCWNPTTNSHENTNFIKHELNKYNRDDYILSSE